MLEDDAIDPKEEAIRYLDQAAAEEDKKFNTVLDYAIMAFENRAENECEDPKQADELAAEMGSQIAHDNGYPNGGDEFDIIVSALSNRAGELFPGEW